MSRSILSPVTSIAASRPLARTPHTCIICGKPIAIGSQYNRHVYRDNDTLDRRHALRVVKYHTKCPPMEALDD